MDIKPSNIPISGAPNEGVTSSGASGEARDAVMRRKAEEFEAVFIGQFLKHAGFENAFGQEAGHYSQFLLEELSEQLAKAGGFGVADDVYQQLKEKDAAGDDAARAIENNGERS